MKKTIIYFAVAVIAAILVGGGLFVWRSRQSANQIGQKWGKQYQAALNNLSNLSSSSVNSATKSVTKDTATTTSGQKSSAEATYDKAADLNISSEAGVKVIDTIMKPVFNKTWGGTKLTAYNTNAYNYSALSSGTLVTYKVKKEISANDTNALITNLKSAGMTVKISQQDSQSAELSVTKDNTAYDISYDIGGQEVMVGVIGSTSASGDSGDEAVGDDGVSE